MTETDKVITVKAFLVWKKRTLIKIKVAKNQLTIKGEKKSETEHKNKQGSFYMKAIS